MTSSGTSSSATPSLASIATIATKDHLQEHEGRCTTSVMRKRFVNMVVDSHTHHTAQNTATTHAMRTGVVQVRHRAS